MGDQRKRQRTESMVITANQKKESKLWHEEANSHLKAGNFAKSLCCYDKALELNPNEKNSLVARSKCNILLGRPDHALRDAETALQVDRHFIKAIFQKAEALYYLGDFEHALMYYHRGLHIRPDHQSFKMGVQKSRQAIENAIGSFIVSKDISAATPSSNRRSTPSGSNKGKSRRPKPSKLLRELAADKDYLDELMTNPDINCKFKENDDSIKKCVRETVEYLNARQEFWRQQLPRHLK